MASALARIIRQYLTCQKKNRAGSLGFWPVNIPGTNYSPENPTCYIVMLHFISDAILIKLAQECNMPRGFPVVWFPEKSVYLYGFRPKFNNDERQSDDSGILSLADNLDIMPKLSGFLGQVVVFPCNGQYWAVACSKNSTGKGNKFALDAERIVKSWLSDEIINVMGEKNLYLCGEVMSQDDQTHGAQVLKEEFIVTAIGTCLMLELKAGRHQGRDTKTFSKHMSHRELNAYCVKYQIPVTAIWFVDSNVDTFVKDLTAARDKMTMAKFNQFIEDHKGDMTIYEGTVKHEDILGDALEGLIIWVNTHELTIKYKFPEYTHRTFCYRAWIGNYSDKSHAFRPNYVVKFMRFLSGYLEHWVISAEGKQYWRKRILSQLIDWKTSGLLDIELTRQDPVGAHIRLAEHPVLESELESQTQTDIKDEFRKVFESTDTENMVDIVLFLGPIGVGKSTRSLQLAEFYNDSEMEMEIIDGDTLGTTSENVLKMSQERNFYTKYAIVKAIMKGKIPVISTGGGALLGRDVNSFFDSIINICGMTPRLHLFLPCERHLIKSFYNEWNVEPIIRSRLKSGSWTCTSKVSDFIRKIAKQSQKNREFAQTFSGLASYNYMYPRIEHGKHNYQRELDNKSWMPDDMIIKPAKTLPGTLNGRQLRLLCRTNYDSGDNYSIGHVTLFFSNTIKEVDTSWIEQLETLKGNHSGTLYKCPAWSFVHVELDSVVTRLDPEATHITINSGKHMPKEMKVACKQVVSGKETINLPLKSGVMQSYPIAKVKSIKVMVDVIDVFIIC